MSQRCVRTHRLRRSPHGMRFPSGRPLSTLASPHNDRTSKGFNSARSRVCRHYNLRLGQFCTFLPHGKDRWFGQVVMRQKQVEEFCAMVEYLSVVLHTEMSV